jgi:heme-degrading monooxygenase HmoA
MIAVIFEFWTNPDKADVYWDHARAMSELVKEADGFLSIERFQSVAAENKFVSLSFWRDGAAIQAWRNTLQHRMAQTAGRDGVFRDYRLRVAEVIRDYGMTDRSEAPEDSRAAHG